MLALQHHGSMMGLNRRGQFADAVTTTVAERVAKIRSDMLKIGIPVALGSGVLTMVTFAGAFGLAHTERIWAPAAWLGAATAVGALISVAIAAKTIESTTAETTVPPDTTQPAAYFY